MDTTANNSEGSSGGKPIQPLFGAGAAQAWIPVMVAGISAVSALGAAYIMRPTRVLRR